MVGAERRGRVRSAPSLPDPPAWISLHQPQVKSYMNGHNPPRHLLQLRQASSETTNANRC